MNKRVEMRPAARQDFLEASDWYRTEDVDLNAKFVGAVRETFKSITDRPLSYPIVSGNFVRRAVVKKFPFSIYFTIDEDLILVLAIFHDSRNPII